MSEEDYSTGWGKKKKKSKYYNQKTTTTEILDDNEVKVKKESDSKLERFTKRVLDEYKIPYEYQYWYELFPSHKNWEGETIKRMKLIVDFKIVTPCGITIWLDPKGLPTEEARLKFKILSFKETQAGNRYVIKWVRSDFEAARFVEKIHELYFSK